MMDLLAGRRYRIASHGVAAAYAGWLLRQYGADVDHVTDESQAVEALGLHPRLVLGARTNIKITYPDDLELAAAIMAQQRRAAELARDPV